MITDKNGRLDIELIKVLSELNQRGLTLIVRKDGETIFESKETMLRPLVDCIRTRKERMRGAIVIDKVVGEAAAKLFIYAKVASVYTMVASKGAVRELNSFGVNLRAAKAVENILAKDRKDLCPMEKMSRRFNCPEEFYEKLSEMMKY